MIQNPNDESENFVFEPLDIQLEDDAFHGPKDLYSYEWWYFDASLTNGYSIQLSIRVLNMFQRVLFTTSLNVYKDGDAVSESQKIYYREEVTVSLVEPLVILDGKEIMRGYIDNETKEWIYRVNLEMDKTAIDFTFVGTSQGWKGLTPGIGWWAVVLPQADVTGTLTLDNTILEVTGTGYHDHNWYVTALAGVNYGWYWGKIHTTSYTVTWADVKMTRFSENPFIVINQEDGEYINIPVDAIELTPSDVSFQNGKFIPNQFRLQINEKNIQLSVTMEVLGIHHFRRFGFIHYWRYHLHCQGHITVNGHTEHIDEYNMAELLRFR